MKKIGFIIVLFLVSFLPRLGAQNDVFPTYYTENYAVSLNLALDSIASYTDDFPHRICDSIMYYEVVGMPPSSQNQWINTVGGNQYADSVESPTSLLCRMLHAYKSGSLNNVLSLYRSQDIPFINSMMADSVSYSRFILSIGLISKMDFLLSAQQGPYTVAIVDLWDEDSVIGNVCYYMVENNGIWKFASVVDSINTFPINVSYFVQFYPPSSITSSADFDMDGVSNLEDNCPCTYNPNQQDMDHDGIGDECDNCPITYNPTQIDSDDDGIGDECDNCPRHYNPLQEDTDGDRIGDSCDNCPTVVNPRQYDFDSDSIGDECDLDIDGDSIANDLDPDRDGDGVADSVDNCPIHYNPSQYDSDEDGIGDACDNCPLHANPDQYDRDGDGVGDACETDLDHDGVPNTEDNCPETYNPDQADKDCDGIGDVCDPDKDGDGVPNEQDNCPDTYNPDQRDINQNGIGDICE